jgi:hypothetical protein
MWYYFFFVQSCEVISKRPLEFHIGFGASCPILEIKNINVGIFGGIINFFYFRAKSLVTHR